MSPTPVLPVPPEGALDILSAMREYLTAELQSVQACEAQQRDLEKQFRAPPGGHRWPETDPRRIEAAKIARGKALRAARDAVANAKNDHKLALIDGLRSGALIAYAVTGSLGDGYRQIPRSHWDELQIASLRESMVSGSATGSMKILVGRQRDGKQRAVGRPRSEAHAFIIDAYRKRLQAGQALYAVRGEDGAHKEAAELIRILRATHPEIKSPANDLVAAWIRKELDSSDPQ
ncbi:hypothetical protein [Paracoccus litorisediminis]|uniref:Uncharacterized protein n=1 Tax=Paracoccus litorisediminis TaxID=2006130 RepID=A0A844HQP8_9RHOB|nr:hypothetical protein [Paracoccus litorisediminis]MTH60001.1 hypothetical protein [Paracoccus litorisediminis]